ncbi:MAG: glycine/sarcosine/betaine reductase complex component C subunit alpha [Synergistales bacterium]
MMDLSRTIGDTLLEIVEAAKAGGPRRRIGLMARGSELGPEEMATGARLAQNQTPGLSVVMIGPKLPGYEDLEWIETEETDCEARIGEAMERALSEKRIDGAVALHYPFPMGVTTIGRVLTPGKGRDMLVASTTGSSSTQRTEAMLRNAILGIAVAKAIGKADPKVGILNVEGAQTVYRALSTLRENGYPVTYGESVRKDGGAILRGNDILAGAVDVCVTDTLTGNVLMKLFSSFTTGGSYESIGWGYGPSVGEGWPHVISIISRASGAPVIANALTFTAAAASAGLPEIVKAEMKRAMEAGLEAVLSGMRQKPAAAAEEISPPSAEPTDEEIHGIDVLNIEEAVRVLWKAGLYAESAMGCTGPVVKISSKNLEKAESCLKKAGYL